ncbi:PIM3 kinase, partial [Chaetorhynchus papuensis]|nr:PIM3 kinase [Chaetorhynchus papuensis]
QVLEAVRHCTSCGVLHRDIKPGNILIELATGQLKRIDFGCGAFLQDTAYTNLQALGAAASPDELGVCSIGTLSYSPSEWSHLKCYHGETAMIWFLGILLHQMVCGKHPFKKGQDIIWGQLLFPRRLSPECKDLIRWCLSMHSMDRPSLEDLFYDPWLQ